MGLEAAESADAASLRTGSEATLKLLATTLERFGISEIDPEGEPFDPEFHEAVDRVEDSEHEPGTVVSVLGSVVELTWSPVATSSPSPPLLNTMKLTMKATMARVG